MNVFKKLTAIFLVLSMLLISVTAEGTRNLYFTASFNLETGEATMTEKEDIVEKDFSGYGDASDDFSFDVD